MNFYRPKEVLCKKTESGEHTRCPRGRGRALLPRGCLVPFPDCFLFSYFLKYSKTEKKMLLELFWSRFTYRTMYLFLFGVWNVLESVPYVFLRGYGFNNISFNIYRITWDIMFDSLTVPHPRTCAFEVVDFYGTGTIDLLDDVRTFPFREEFSCKKS